MSILLSVKCRRHPDYSARKKPVGACQACESLWKLAQNGWQIKFPDGSSEWAERHDSLVKDRGPRIDTKRYPDDQADGFKD